MTKEWVDYASYCETKDNNEQKQETYNDEVDHSISNLKHRKEAYHVIDRIVLDHVLDGASLRELTAIG